MIIKTANNRWYGLLRLWNRSIASVIDVMMCSGNFGFGGFWMKRWVRWVDVMVLSRSRYGIR